MPLPVILGVAAAIAGAGGLGAAGHGAFKMKKAKDTMDEAIRKNNENLQKFELKNNSAVEVMDRLGKREISILSSFDEFANVIEKIQNRPAFDQIELGDIRLPKYEPEKLKEVSVGAGVLLGGLGGAAAGTAGGFAAAGAATSAVMALGTASTGTAIASLSGAAATNATLAALGGGAIAAGGGGMALGTTILGVSTLGIGLLVGGIIFHVSGAKMSSRAEEAYEQMKKTESDINEICNYLQILNDAAKRFLRYFDRAAMLYESHLDKLKSRINETKCSDWNDFDANEKLSVQNTVLLVGLLYRMCKVGLVMKNETGDALHKVNEKEIEKAVNEAQIVISMI